ncbi:MAG: hypothetical protein KJ559_00575 [Nanoarchaeota archaeon]|nr:hypothetical protein [Nanoarchaeota archaeon]
MNPERKFKIGILIFIFCSIILSFFLLKIVEINVILFLLILITGLIILIVIETYLRIQHNIDRKFKIILEKQTEIQEISENNYKKLNIKITKEKNNIQNEFKKVNESLDKEKNNIQNEFKKVNESLDKEKNNIQNEFKKVNELNENLKINQKIQQEQKNKIFCMEKKISEQFSILKTMSWLNLKKERIKSILELAPNVFDYKSVLYIGARTDRFDFSQEFRKANYKITVVEAYKENVEYLKKIPWLKEVIYQDIRKFKSSKKYDIVFWWHGPEHIEKEELKKTLKKLESMCNKIIVLGCPWGDIKLKELSKNPYEKHLSDFDGDEFEKLGYSVECIGEKNIFGSNITAIKYIKK